MVPRLIEVALPIREISAESVRDKSLRHGHISTLHLWFARRPLAASRAVVFASLVPDPDHPECPPAFRAAVEQHLKTHVPDVLKSYRRGKVTHLDPDPYRPYDGQEDTLRNRLLAFIAKWSPEWLAFEQGKSKTEPKPENLLDDRSLVKWETSGPTTKVGSKLAPNEVGRKILWIARELTRIANGNQIPTVLDPFAGGGAIPLEAGRVGAQAIANDYNPVAYLILRATCEFPQKYGKPGMRKQEGTLAETEVPNVLAYDVEHYAKEILRRAKEKIGHLYPVGKDKCPVVGYLWARTAPCSNLSCKAEIPLIKSLIICNKPEKKVALTLTVQENTVIFGVVTGTANSHTEGTVQTGGSTRCPFCGQITPVKDIRQAGMGGKIGKRLLAAIIDTPQGKKYRAVEETDLVAVAEASTLASSIDRPREIIVPEINGPTASPNAGAHRSISVDIYGYKTFGSLIDDRPLVILSAFTAAYLDIVDDVQKSEANPGYTEAVLTYLALWISWIAQRSTNLGRLHSTRETYEQPFGQMAIPMVWDYAEANPFAESSGGAGGGFDWIVRVLEREGGRTKGLPAKTVLGDAATISLPAGTVNAIVTDPPYFDAVAYADLSDFFYVWLKRTIGTIWGVPFVTPQTPKSEEAVAHKHRHAGNRFAGADFYQRKLAACFHEASRLCKADGVISVIFAHQTTQAWTALINAILAANLNITATFPIDTELKNRSRGMDVSALESSITVICRPRVATTPGSFKDVRRDIDRVVKESVHRFWAYGFRGADLIVACYGPAVGEFGKYERVERGDGTLVTVPELLQLVRESALKAIAGEFHGDQLSRLYFVWANLYGIAEQAWDDVRLVVQLGGEAEDAMRVATGRGLFVVEGSNSRLAVLADRAGRTHLGDDKSDPLIDQLHRAMLLWKAEDRAGLVKYLHGHDLADHAGFWRLAQALFEVLPRDGEDWKLVSALLGERNTLRTEIKRRDAAQLGGGASLFDGQEE